MSRSIASSIASSIARAALKVICILTLVQLLTQTAAAQEAARESVPQPRRWEFRVASGTLIPTGELRLALRTADLTAAQVAWLPRPSLAVTGTFGWARSRDLGAVGTPKLDVFTSDLGAELRTAEWFAGRAVTVSPFVGLGAGMRSYDSRARGMDAAHTLSGYASVGGEVGYRRVGVRLEVRDYASGSGALAGAGASEARNDAVVMAALRLNRRPGVRR